MTALPKSKLTEAEYLAMPSRTRPSSKANFIAA